jgi:hypothetical protein
MNTHGTNEPSLASLAERIIKLCLEEQDIDDAADLEERQQDENYELEERHEAETNALVERHVKENIDLNERLKPQRLPLRVERGRLLLEARELVPKGTWEKWCDDNLRPKDTLYRPLFFENDDTIELMSQSDIRACMALARSDDPTAAHEEEKANAAERQRKSRANKRNKQTAVTGDDVTAVTHVPGPAPLPVKSSDTDMQDVQWMVAAWFASTLEKQDEFLRQTGLIRPAEPKGEPDQMEAA